ncbi:hypothetical protein DFH06DRAFT_1183148, partial [Mycena polygramma]
MTHVPAPAPGPALTKHGRTAPDARVRLYSMFFYYPYAVMHIARITYRHVHHLRLTLLLRSPLPSPAPPLRLPHRRAHITLDALFLFFPWSSLVFLSAVSVVYTSAPFR